MASARIPTTVSSNTACLTRDQNIGPLSAEFTDYLFGNTIAIDISSVYKASSCLVIQVELVTRFMDVSISTPGHRA
jgi:hypothetical protein